MSESLLIFTLLNVLLAWSVYIILLSGSLSFANGGFMAIGAYASGVLTVKLGVPLIAATLIAAAACGAFGALISIPALRTRGVYLILVTTGITFCVKVAIESINYIGGIRGMGGMQGTTVWHLIALTVLVGGGLWLLARTPLQRVLDAVREDERVAKSLGINAVYVKVVTFGIGAALAALAGGYYSHYVLFISPADHFNILVAIYIVLYVVLGGVNNLWGPLVGAVVMTVAPELIRDLKDWRPAVFGLLIVVVLLIRPSGLLPFRTITARGNGGKPKEDGEARP
ncbi:MAG: branched-chain amino acid ABC transporter permease [Alphaproteobacteria bacterium]